MYKLEDYRGIVEDKILYELYQKARNLYGKRIININSTYQGGGVAEILRSLVPLMNEVGVDAGWRIFHGTPDFFNVTKKIHNAIQGENVKFSDNELKLYYKTNEDFSIYTHINHDLCIIHDPQPLPLISFYKKKRPWIWRCHVDASNPSPILDYLKQYIIKYDSMILSSDDYIMDNFPVKHSIIQPAIDPSSLKNRELSSKVIKKCLKDFHILTDKPIICQISRFDKWKNPLRVLKTFMKVREKVDCRLVLCGSMAADDPEGIIIYEDILKRVKELSYKDDIILTTVESELLVNSLQRASDVILQLSSREGFGLCVLPETNIITSNGYKEIKDIDTNDYVLTKDGSFKRVLDKTHRRVDYYYNVTCHKGMCVGVTEEHPFLALKRVTKKKPRNVNEYDLRWLKVKELNIGDYIAAPIPKRESCAENSIFDLKDLDDSLEFDDNYVWYKTAYSSKTGCLQKTTRFIDIEDKDIQWLIGLYIGDGSQGNGSFEFSLNKLKEYRLAYKAKSVIKERFGKESTITERKNVIRVYCCSKILCKFFKQFGTHAYNKDIPNSLLKIHNSLSYLLVGMFDSDGEYRKNYARYSTINKNLAWKMWYILISNKIPAVIRDGKADRGFKTNNKSYVVFIGGREYYRFIDKYVKNIHSFDMERGSRVSDHCIITDNYILYPVKSIKKVENNVEVLDICVDKSHSFVGNGYLLHNTVTEAMYKGKSVIASNVGGIPLQIQDGVNGYLVSLNDIQNCADKVIEILKNNKLCKELGKTAKATVIEKFLMTRLLSNYLDLINTLI